MFHKKKKHVTITKERTQKSLLLVCALFSAFACVCVYVCLGVQKREKDAACVDGCSAIKCVRRNGEIANNNNQTDTHGQISERVHRDFHFSDALISCCCCC